MIKLAILFFVFYVITILSLILSKITYYSVDLVKSSGIIPLEEINYVIESDLKVSINDRQINVPSGFKTDLASIPRILWPLFAPNESDTIYPAILHDYLYSCGGWVTRKYADDALYSFLLERGYPRYKSFAFYVAVRLFGAAHFTKRNNKCEFEYIRK